MENPDQRWRVFSAIELPAPVRELVLRHIARLKEAVPGARASWVRDSSLHLTLKFLGEIPQTSVTTFSQAAALAVSQVLPFSIRLEQTGIFPNRGRPRVLWLGVNDSSAQLAVLHERLEEESAKAGFAKGPLSFHPHLSIARLRKPEHAQAVAAAHLQLKFEPREIAVAELVVIRSELSSEGSKYTIVSRHQLARRPERAESE